MRRYSVVPDHVREFLEKAQAGALAPTPAATPVKRKRRRDIEQLYAEARDREATAPRGWIRGAPLPNVMPSLTL